jgi:hypothetical protein
VAHEGARLISCAMVLDKIGHHSNLLTCHVPNSSEHWPPKKTNSPSMPIAARTVHLGHGMVMSRICDGSRSIFQHGTWVPRNRLPHSRLGAGLKRPVAITERKAQKVGVILLSGNRPKKRT